MAGSQLHDCSVFEWQLGWCLCTYGGGVDSFFNLCGRLVLRDVQSSDDLLLPIARSREFFFVLEGLAELFGEVFALPVKLL